MTIIYFILILGITVFIHELGHFLFAKKAGIYVYEFALGMGPRLFKWKSKKDETIYSIRLFPIGGYVQMAGESIEDDETIPNEKKMQNKTWLQRFLTIIAGVVFNFILAIVILFIIALIKGAPQPNAYIASLDAGFPALTSGMQIEDEIIKINNKKINSSDMLLMQLQVNNGKTIDVTVRHSNNQTETFTLEPKEIEEDGNTVYRYGFAIENKIEYGILPSIKYAFVKTGLLIEQMVYVIAYLFTGIIGLNSLAGPIGIYNIVGQSAAAGFINVIYLLAFISINVGFINLLPIPAFDGGRIIFLIIEKIKGSPINAKTENIIHTIGFVLLMLLMVVITFNDINRLI